MFRRVSIRLAACLLLMGGAPAMAADAPTLVSAGFSATGMGFRLIDLDPDDGIDPYWLHVPDDAKTYLSANLGEGGPQVSQALPGSFFEAPLFEAQNASGTVGISRGPDHMSGHSSVTTADLPKLTDASWLPAGAPPGTKVFGTSTSLTNDFSGTSEAFWERTWVLSPRTAVVFDGHVQLSGAVDLSGLDGTSQTGQVKAEVNARLQLSLGSASYFPLYTERDFGGDSDDILTAARILQDPQYEMWRWRLGGCCADQRVSLSNTSVSEAYSLHQVWTDGQLDRPAEQRSLDTPFSFRIDNTGDQEMVGAIMAKMSTSTYLIAQPAPVPEPGTGLFMGLGLGLAGLVRSWRRAVPQRSTSSMCTSVAP
ncbi:MAG: PEP-CTERM sorting domain-containing protein [Aquabacterium sp.]